MPPHYCIIFIIVHYRHVNHSGSLRIIISMTPKCISVQEMEMEELCCQVKALQEQLARYEAVQ